jgi:N-acetylated-alpha-linked acidic dipeptidase
MRLTGAALALLALAASVAAEEAAPDPHRFWSKGSAAKQARYEEILQSIPDATRLRSWHDLLASRPHVAGTPGDRQVADAIERSFKEMGLEVERHAFWAYLPRPASASVTVTAPERVELPMREEALPEDPWSASEELDGPWNAYSGSGVAEGEVVYVHHGRKEDFERLAEMGVDLEGKIALARYGGNFRGYKALFAERAGAAGLVIFTDPKDVGFVRGPEWPEGGWAHPSHVQRGSILALPYRGDPLTPGRDASKHARRLKPEDVALPKIPVQPVSWVAAKEILSRMEGEPVPGGWQGGLPFTYRLTGGPRLKVRVAVEQDLRLRETWNIVGTLRGTEQPDELVVMGAHHDAWSHGAADPTSGTILVMEAARSLSEAAKRGHRPARSIAFAGWGAEEYGIIGSSEWVEKHRKRLLASGVAYLNADMAATGVNFGPSAAPPLQALIEDVARSVPQAREPGRSVWEHWLARAPHRDDPGRPRFGDLGGGSDHVGFLCHAGVPSLGLSAGGAPGTSYHGLHDDLAWYRATVGEDYEPALMLTRIATLSLSRLANGELLPIDPIRPAVDFRRHLKTIGDRAEELGLEPSFERAELASRMYELTAGSWQARLLASLDAGTLDAASLAAANRELLRLERAWLRDEGLPDRPWFKSTYAAPDEWSGYAPWMLPLLRKAVESRDEAAVAAAIEEAVGVFRGLEARLARVPVADAAPRSERRARRRSD